MDVCGRPCRLLLVAFLAARAAGEACLAAAKPWSLLQLGAVRRHRQVVEPALTSSSYPASSWSVLPSGLRPWGGTERPPIPLLSRPVVSWGHTAPQCLENVSAGASLAGPKTKPHIFVLVPGFGNSAHTGQVLENVRWLQRQDVDVSCVIYIYSADLQLPFPSDFSPCELIRTAGLWTSFVKKVPEHFWVHADYVLLWLDDVVPVKGVDLRRMVETARANGLSVLSPSYASNASSRWEVMRENPLIKLYGAGGSVGRRSDFVEFQMTLMRPSSFRCLRDMVESKNPAGWGLDLYFSSMCPGHCMGIMDDMTMNDTSTGSYSDTSARIQMNRFMEEHPANIGKHSLAVLSPPDSG